MKPADDFEKIYIVRYTKDGVGPLHYQIPATSRDNALVRLGQIYGDRPGQSEKEIKVESITP